jgi:single stranded DNA-binding protein
MRGIHAAFEGRLGREAELRVTKQGKPWPSFSLALDTEGEGDTLTTTWVRVAYFGTDAEALAGKLIKGTEAYIEGWLKLDTWTAKDSSKRSGLSVVAWKVVPLGQIGRKRSETSHKPRPKAQAAHVLTQTMRFPSRRMESRRQESQAFESRVGIKAGENPTSSFSPCISVG